jgi:hypothetical protein
MRCPPRRANNLLLSGAVLFACVHLTACGDWCFSGVINNPNGVIITTKNASPPPSCPPQTILTTMNVAVVKSQLCLACTSSIRAEHIFVTLTSIQLRSAFPDAANSTEWIDLAPQLRAHPREMDLVGDSTPLILAQNAPLPTGTYRDVRLQFVTDTSANSSDALPDETSCGPNHANCLLMSNGNVEQLDFAGDSPELVLPLQMNGSNSLAVLPGTRLDLRLSLQPQQLSSISASQGWQVHFTLAGSASISR